MLPRLPAYSREFRSMTMSRAPTATIEYAWLDDIDVPNDNRRGRIPNLDRIGGRRINSPAGNHVRIVRGPAPSHYSVRRREVGISLNQDRGMVKLQRTQRDRSRMGDCDAQRDYE